MIRTLLLVAALAAAGPAAADDPIINYGKDDAVMNAAIADARATLPLFYEKMEGADLSEGNMLLKVGFPYGTDDSEEHIWVALLDRREDLFIGILANDPVHIDYRLHDPVTFEEADISDWMYWRDDGLMEGAFTIRAMLPDLPPEQAAQLRASLAPLPKAP